MATDDIERLHYYQRQYLGALDFEDQQAYHRDMRRRLNLAHHTWGIVAGLELAVGANGVDINITPGLAIDGFGREIVMFAPTQLDPALFRSFHGQGYHTVCLEYTEALTQSPQAGYGQCDQPNQLGRVGENFQVLVEDPSRDDITVNGQAIVFPTTPTQFFTGIKDPEDMPVLPPPPLPTPGPDNQILPLDESVPYQELPVDDPAIPIIARWLIRLGRVHWDGTTGIQRFVGDKNNPIILEDGRHYIGSVASRLLTPARNLIVRDRNTNVPLPVADPKNPDGVVMTIEGTLQVDRLLTAKAAIEIDGGALDFRDAGGSSDGKGGTDPLFTITRQETHNTTGIDLRVQIGQDSNGNDRFVVGSGAKDLFMVADNGSTTVTGDVLITGVLDFGSKTRQMIDLWTTNDGKKQYGIGVQTNTTYFRSHNAFCWFQDGVHSDTQSDPGAGGQLQLKLDLNGDLYFGARTRQMLNLWKSDYGIGVQANTLYCRSDSDFCWFKNGIHSDAQDDPGGGTLQMKLGSDGGLCVAGPVDLKNNLTVEGTLNLKRNLMVAGPIDLNSNLTIAGALDFGSQPRQMIALWTSQDKKQQNAIGIQGSGLPGSPPTWTSTYFRSSNDFYWYTGGSYSSKPGEPGIAGTMLMQLSMSGGLVVNAPSIAFHSTTQSQNGTPVSVTLGQGRGAHGADSIYGSPDLWLDAADKVYIKNGFSQQGMDGAERFPYSEPIEPGDVVVLSTEGKRSIKSAEHAYDTSVVGVVSTDPAFILGGAASAAEIETNQQNNVPVALIGTVPCKVDANIAPIHIGDLLTTSPTKGHAQKILDLSKATGAVLGKAMGNLENGKGFISVFVMMC